MKKFIFLFLSFFCLSSLTPVPTMLSDSLSISEIKPGLFIVTDSYPWTSNSLIAVMENNDILMVDTPYTPESTGLLLNWIHKTFGKPGITAVNTHFHIDRLGGNAALVKDGIPVYGSELTLKEIKEHGDRSIKLMISMMSDPKFKNYFANFKYTPPTEIFDSSKGLTLNFGNEKAEIKYYGIGHSVDNLIVYLPGKKTIFGGCMILSMEAKNAGNTSDGNICEWIKTMDKIDTKNYDLIIPGHGKAGGLELLKHTEEILKNGK
jgi:metallo-beta-lactamase class B